MESSARLVALALLVGAILGSTPSQGNRILMVPGIIRSHQALFASIAEELLRKQHEVYVYIGEAVPVNERLDKLPITFLKYYCDDPGFHQTIQGVYHQLAINAIEKNGDARTVFSTAKKMVTQECNRLLSAEKLLVTLENLNFDVAIIHDSCLFRCYSLVPHRLGVPFISVVDIPEPWLLRVPWLPSAVPHRLFPHTEEMTFLERLKNTFFQLVLEWMPLVPQPSEDIVERYRAYGEFSALTDVSKRSKLYLMTSDYHLDYAVPMMPFMIPVAGLTIVPNGQLPADYNTIIDQSPDGVIVVSFGTMIMTFPDSVATKMTAAFASVNQTIFWRFRNVHDIDIPQNVHVREWLPQNELLAHHKVKLFITHGGNNGQHEALYHGVPMIAFPFFSDQAYNALRLQRKGFGIAMDIATFTTDELVSNINKVTEGPTYKASISKTSKMIRSRPEPPAQKAAFWIEHVIKYGADHLHSYSQDMPWYQFLMLDIAAFSLLVLIALCWIVRKLFCCILRPCCKAAKQKVE